MRSSLRGGGLHRQNVDTSYNPLDGLANLADCMLVLACGLMLALIVSWNLDIGSESSAPDLEPAQDLATVEGVEDSEDVSPDTAQSYEELGKVYKDPATGQLYLVPNQ